jgi:transcription-repair coupling factor (superfamily II helicase)
MAMESDDEVLREAVLREMDRDGQVFVLHNRISSIYHVAEHIRRVVPQARIEVGHGQLPEGQLDRLMLDFYLRKLDVLVSTAIIENGVDFPNANTIIVYDAEHFGLAQLYQLRGRVGRSDRQAYAYLTWRPRKKLTPAAAERVAAIKEFSALGSGYRVALRDLELRGAGDLLGAEQHGALAAVGFEMYSQMLEEAVKIVKGEAVEPEREIQIDLPIDAALPVSYVPELNQRVDLYRRLAAVRQATDAEAIRAELLDRYGKPLPVETDALFRLLAIKLRCKQVGVVQIIAERDAIAVRLDAERILSPWAVKRLTFEAPKWRARGLPAPAFTAGRVTLFTLNQDTDTVLSTLEEVLDHLRTIEDEVAKGPGTSARPAPRPW